MAKRKAQGELQHIYSSLNKTLKKHRFDLFRERVNLKFLWGSVAGEIICAHSRATRITGKTLHVTVSSSSWLYQISMHTDSLLEKINKIPAAPEVERIKLSLGDFPGDNDECLADAPLTEKDKRFIEETVASIRVGDAEFRETLGRVLKKGIIRRNLLERGKRT